jgi:3-hydroxymyristoyl/3-hydroxydecanoyl-(acyl carrier protein) dehydratase
MIKRKPKLLSHHVADNQARLVLKVDADIKDFEGHFPSFALLPGVTQIDWVLFYAKNYLGIDLPFSGMEVIKFQEPILPKAIIELELNWDNKKQKLQFCYSSKTDTIFSSGKIKLGIDDVHS